MSLYYELHRKKQPHEKGIDFKNFKVHNQYLIVKQLKNRKLNHLKIPSLSPSKSRHLPHLRLPSLPTSESPKNQFQNSPKHEQNSFQEHSVQLSKLQKSFEFKEPQSEFYIMHRIVDPPLQRKQPKLTYISDDLSFEYKLSKIKQKYSFHQFNDSNCSHLN